MQTNEIVIFGSVWATVNGTNEYDNNEIVDLVNHDFDEWGFAGDQLDDEGSICISVHFDKSLLHMQTFSDLHAALTFIAVQQKEIVEHERDAMIQRYRSLRDDIESRTMAYEERNLDVERSNELARMHDDDVIDTMVCAAAGYFCQTSR